MAAKSALFYHIILTTKYRRGVLGFHSAAFALSSLSMFCALRGGTFHAFAVGSDHAHCHALVSLPAHVAVADFVRDVKSRSARIINDQRSLAGRPRLSPFWGRRFWVRSVAGSADIKRVREYINSQ